MGFKKNEKKTTFDFNWNDLQFYLEELIIDFSYERLMIIWIIWTMLELQL